MSTVEAKSTSLDAAAIDGLSRKLCEAAAALRYEDLPAAVIRQVKLLVLDTLGVIGAARSAPGISILHDQLQRWEKTGSATALLDKLRLSPPSAALANGAAAHALDFDDIHDEARVHTATVLLPALLATAEDIGSINGRDFILAMAVGAEINARLGLTCFNCLDHGWHPTTLFGVMSSAIAVSKLLGSDAETMLGAFGFAHHLACGSKQSILDSALTKRVGPGFAARSALTAAYLAKDGLKGPHRPLEGQAGLFLLQERGEVIPTRLLDGFGRNWEVLNYGFKPFPCCRCCHSTIDLGLQFHKRGIDPDQIEAITIWQPAVNFRTVGVPYEASRDSVVHAQFNAAYCFARALRDGKVDLRTFQQPQITDAGIVAITRRTTVLVDPDMDPIAMGPVRVALQMRSGQTETLETSALLGGPESPLSEAVLVEKFRACLSFGLDAEPAAIDALANRVLNIEREGDVAAIVAAFPDNRQAD
jgi:2-methylcitrate dehydratase PrpD